MSVVSEASHEDSSIGQHSIEDVSDDDAARSDHSEEQANVGDQGQRYEENNKN